MENQVKSVAKPPFAGHRVRSEANRSNSRYAAPFASHAPHSTVHCYFASSPLLVCPLALATPASRRPARSSLHYKFSTVDLATPSAHLPSSFLPVLLFQLLNTILQTSWRNHLQIASTAQIYLQPSMRRYLEVSGLHTTTMLLRHLLAVEKRHHYSFQSGLVGTEDERKSNNNTS